jgi:hypothetical protein
MREAFADQDLSDITACDRQRSTQPPMVAKPGALLTWLAGAGNALQARGIAAADQGLEACGGRFSAATLVIATCLVSPLRRVETDEAVRSAVHAHRIAVDHSNRTG